MNDNAGNDSYHSSIAAGSSTQSSESQSEALRQFDEKVRRLKLEREGRRSQGSQQNGKGVEIRLEEAIALCRSYQVRPSIRVTKDKLISKLSKESTSKDPEKRLTFQLLRLKEALSFLRPLVDKAPAYSDANCSSSLRKVLDRLAAQTPQWKQNGLPLTVDVEDLLAKLQSSLADKKIPSQPQSSGQTSAGGGNLGGWRNGSRSRNGRSRRSNGRNGKTPSRRLRSPNGTY